MKDFLRSLFSVFLPQNREIPVERARAEKAWDDVFARLDAKKGQLP